MPNPPIISGYFPNSAQNTPTGQPKQVAFDSPYLEKDEFLLMPEARGLGITILDPSYANGDLQNTLLAASAAVNRYCRRWFDTQTIDETRTQFSVRPYNPQLVTVTLANSPYQVINSIYIQVLKWFIPVISSGPESYLQDFPDLGYYKIVPMLSSSGQGVGSPIPAEIIDRQPLGVLWTNYTFGYGQPIANLILLQVGNVTETHQWQAPVGYRLWAKTIGITVYDGASVVAPANYSVDWVNGIITFINTYTVLNPTNINVTIQTNESVPFEIKKATALVASWLIGQSTDNPLGVTSYNIQTYGVNFGNDNKTEERFKKLLEPHRDTMLKVL
jgi:hypothetical protein